MSADAKRECPYCGKTLRSDNSTGICAKCQANGKKPGDAADAALLSEKPKAKAARSDVQKRFRTVAVALGKDPDAILDEAAQEWLDAVAKAVE